MRLTKFTDLALRAVMRLAVSERDEPLTTREVAQDMGVPAAHMAKAINGSSIWEYWRPAGAAVADWV